MTNLLCLSYYTHFEVQNPSNNIFILFFAVVSQNYDSIQGALKNRNSQ